MTKLKSQPHRREEGSALLVVLLASSLLAALGLALAALSSVETVIASNQRAGSQLAYAADAALEGVLADLLTIANWSDTLSGAASSRLQGHSTPPAGAGQAPVTLAQLTATVQAEFDAQGSWGANHPRWRMFSHGWLTELAPMATADSDEFIATFVADDLGENDGDPVVDSNRRIQVTARAMSPRGIYRSMLMTVEQTTSLASGGVPGVRVLTRKEIR
jgi:Tfp pilus assembly protein PilX